MQNYSEIWNAVLSEMKNGYSDAFIALWFAETELAAITDTTAVLVIPSNFKRKMLDDKYKPIISKYLRDILGYDTEIVILSSENGAPDLLAYVKGAAPAETARESEPAGGPNFDTAVSREDTDSDTFLTGEARKRYTFDSFLVGSSNKFAHDAAVAVANEPAVAYNPLFIYGASGLGKTHLLYAITNRIMQNDPSAVVIYVTGENFTNQMIQSIGRHDTESFRDKYRKASVLLIDDIQFIAGKVQTQEEFFHTFNALHDEGKQIILTSDRPPKDINPLEDRLRTRFENGLLADIQPPNLELRIAIMHNKAEKMNIDIPDDVLVFLAENLKNNVRQLEGALKKIAAKHYLEDSPVTLELARSCVSDMISNAPPVAVTIDRIITVISQKYGVSADDLKSRKKSAYIVNPRHKCVYLVRKLTDMSLSQIGVIFNRDHTTIMNSINNIEFEIKNNSSFESEMTELIQEINGLSSESAH